MKPVLVGISNPYSSDPRCALWPGPDGCTGWRIWKMLSERTGATAVQYIDRFQRVNVVDLPIMVRSNGGTLLPGKLLKIFQSAGQVVLLGDQVRRAFGLPRVLIHPIVRDGVIYRQVPHPSGLNRWYNCPAQRELVAVLLEDLYRGR